jgi:cell division protein FtsA
MVADDEEIEVPGVGGHAARTVSRRLLSDIIEPRIEEIFAVIRTRIEDTGLLEQLSAGAVLTGGAVLMEGMTEFAEEILGMPVRLGVPVGVRGITQLVAGPQYATGVGLVQYGASALAQARGRAARDIAEAAAHGDAEQETELAKSKRPRRGGSRLVKWLRAAF